ncbi:MAG: serine/threonine protein kinase, partial [Planctomycetes bacterium]|nr:serine/threonine protein kinase [Planctomycetota bacterium]
MSRPEMAELEALFHQARDMSPERREQFLDEACSGRATLRREVQELLRLAQGLQDDVDSAGSPEFDLGRVGPYSICRIIATGGMGTVYEARQDHPQRRIALKLISPACATPAGLERFEFETQHLANLRHPGIAQIYDAGVHVTDGWRLPYFAMEFIDDARDLITYAQEERLDTPSRVRLFVQVCEAVDHGHSRGVIHRDLKPDNILVDAEGHPKIIDFGIAKSMGEDSQSTIVRTAEGDILGTLQYMSPEQFSGDPANVGIQTDVYSLGVVLYQLLADELPYVTPSGSIPEAARIVHDGTRRRLSSANRSLRGDLETVVHTAFERDRSLRYRSCRDLSADLRNVLEQRPIDARRPSALYRVTRWVQRRAALSAALLLGALLLLGLIVGGSYTVSSARTLAKQVNLAWEQGDLRQTLMGYDQGESLTGFSWFVRDDIRRFQRQTEPYQSLRLALLALDDLRAQEEAARLIVDEEAPADPVVTRYLRSRLLDASSPDSRSHAALQVLRVLLAQYPTSGEEFVRLRHWREDLIHLLESSGQRLDDATRVSVVLGLGVCGSLRDVDRIFGDPDRNTWSTELWRASLVASEAIYQRTVRGAAGDSSSFTWSSTRVLLDGIVEQLSGARIVEHEFVEMIATAAILAR